MFNLVSFSETKSREELIQLAYIDTMTGCYNRNFLEEHKDVWNDMLFYVSIVDIDGLKKVNDKYGHNFGDVLIKNAAKYFFSIASLDTIIIRLGGDEFLLLSTKSLVDDLRSGLGISYGSIKKSNNMSLKEAMIQADKLMYRQKQNKK